MIDCYADDMEVNFVEKYLPKCNSDCKIMMYNTFDRVDDEEQEKYRNLANEHGCYYIEINMKDGNDTM